MNDVAIIVSIMAHVLADEVVEASIIASFEKNPAMKGVPINARLPIEMQDVVIGKMF